MILYICLHSVVRDIKPENILYTKKRDDDDDDEQEEEEESTMKLADFGLSESKIKIAS